MATLNMTILNMTIGPPPVSPTLRMRPLAPQEKTGARHLPPGNAVGELFRAGNLCGRLGP
jgi:hypothetical protein